MISYANEPWKKRGLSSFLNHILAVMFLGVILLSYSFMLGNSKALAEPNEGVMETCSTVIIAGDVHAVEDEGADLHKKLKDSGVKTIKSYTHEGRRTNEVVNAIKDVDPKGKCFIIEAGTGNLHDKSSEQNRKEINRMAEKLKDANKVYWVSPVISGDRSDLGVSSKQFNDDLRDVLKDKKNFNVINAQKLSSNPSHFDKESINGAGMRMTSEGYNRRVDLIVDSIQEDLKIETPTSPSPSPSSSAPSNASQAPAPGGGEQTVPVPDSDGDQTTPGGGDKTTPAPTPDGEEDTDPKDPPSENWETDAYSPLSFAEKLDTMQSSEEASRYLTLVRWGVPSVPIQKYSPDNTSFQLNPQNQRNQQILAGAHATMMGGYAFLNAALNSDFGTLALKVGDYFYGKFFGLESSRTASLNGDNKAAFALLSSIFMIAFMLAGWRSLSSMSMSPKQRVSSFFTSIAKTSLVMSFAIVSGTMSKANAAGDAHHDQAMEQIAEGIVNNTSENIDFETLEKDSEKYNMDEIGSGWKKYLLTWNDSKGEKRDINIPSSWRTFSLGWIVSMIYEAGKIFSFAVVSIITIFITGPIESMRNAISKTDTVQRYHNDGVCERYVDAMHVAYGHTSIMASSPATAMAIRSFDLIYYDLIYTIYSRTYGDNTDSTEKGWCWYAEVNSNVHPGEYMMLMRTAGNYGYVIGTGDLITGRNAAAQASYTDGKHSMLSIDSSLSNNTSKTGGILVDASGKWTGGDPDGAVRRAEAFMGVGRGINGASEAKFYHAACDYPQGSIEKPTLSKEWENVIAMFEENDEEDEEKDHIVPITNTIWFAQENSSEESEGENTQSSEEPSEGEDNSGETIEAGDGDGDYSRYLTDADCVAPVDAIRTVVEKPSDSDPTGKWGGFGTISEDGYEAPYASRWNYEQEFEGNNHNSHILTSLRYASDGIKRIKDESDADKPSGKFHINESTVDGEGRIRDSNAKQFWVASTGQSAKGIMSASSSGKIAVAIAGGYALFSTVLVSFAFFINILAFILFFFIAAIVGFALLKFAMFGGSRRLK